MSRRAPPVLTKRLKTARTAAGFSQRGLGIAMGLDPDSASPRINQYERGRREPDLATVSRIAVLLDVPLAYLFCEDDDIAQGLIDLARLDGDSRGKILRRIALLAAKKTG